VASAAGARARVELIFGGEDQLGRQIEELVALWGRIGGIEHEGQPGRAVRADEGDLGKEFIDFFDRLERTSGAFMARLAALFAAGRGRGGNTAGSERRIGRRGP
jgi:hypothetical protein